MKWISLFAFLFAFHGTAFADKPCAKDIETLCKGIEPGQGAIMKCLRKNHDKLSPECKAQGEKMKEEMKEVKEACHDDYVKFCQDVKSGQGRIMKCMKDHKDQLSEKCKEESKEMGHKRKSG